MWRVKLAVNKILNACNVEQQAAVLRVVIDHHDLAAARELAGIKSSKEQATMEYLFDQSAWMLGCASTGNAVRGKNFTREA